MRTVIHGYAVGLAHWLRGGFEIFRYFFDVTRWVMDEANRTFQEVWMIAIMCQMTDQELGRHEISRSRIPEHARRLIRGAA